MTPGERLEDLWKQLCRQQGRWLIMFAHRRIRRAEFQDSLREIRKILDEMDKILGERK